MKLYQVYSTRFTSIVSTLTDIFIKKDQHALATSKFYAPGHTRFFKSITDSPNNEGVTWMFASAFPNKPCSF